jgi:hypothetical protein
MIAAILAGALLIAGALLVILGCELDSRNKTIEGLRDQLDSEQETAAYWYGRAKELHNRLLWSGNVTPSFVGERPTLRASEPRWTDKDGNAIGFNDKVVPLRKGEQS